MIERVIITGASGGLGLETAKILLDKGYKVLNLSRKKPPVDEIEHIEMDLTVEESIDNAVREIEKNYSDFSALINNAGAIIMHELEEINYNDVQTVFQVNLIGPMYLASKLMRLVKENGADIVNVGSTVGYKAYHKQAAYNTSKWAMRGLNLYLQTELKNTGIRVIGFNPGGMKTEFFDKNMQETYDASQYMDPKSPGKMIVTILETPKEMEVSEIVINRKVASIK
ncbi:SDR family NAD(P)-dependent oxidoreductase [Candidatus Dojkabacteria bacterium]|nr:SDR family NAD(P)-dependent oxidoreductase [Candidatus Dojkabacteria bacterium]